VTTSKLHPTTFTKDPVGDKVKITCPADLLSTDQSDHQLLFWSIILGIYSDKPCEATKIILARKVMVINMDGDGQ
jgi:hypothetical protein